MVYFKMSIFKSPKSTKSNYKLIRRIQSFSSTTFSRMAPVDRCVGALQLGHYVDGGIGKGVGSDGSVEEADPGTYSSLEVKIQNLLNFLSDLNKNVKNDKV